MAGSKQQPAVYVSKRLIGIDFPARKEDLVRHASGQGADPLVLDLLRELPGNEYENMADVMKAVGQLR